jgi:hypothetical protein
VCVNVQRHSGEERTSKRKDYLYRLSNGMVPGIIHKYRKATDLSMSLNCSFFFVFIIYFLFKSDTKYRHIPPGSSEQFPLFKPGCRLCCQGFFFRSKSRARLSEARQSKSHARQRSHRLAGARRGSVSLSRLLQYYAVLLQACHASCTKNKSLTAATSRLFWGETARMSRVGDLF